jgi:hypothetical protein
MSSLPEEAFRRYDESPDEEFYLLPRFVTHRTLPRRNTIPFRATLASDGALVELRVVA